MASMSSSQPDEKTAIVSSFNQDTEQSEKSEKLSGCSPFAIPKRYVLAFMAFLGFCNIYALRVNLSVAIIAMTRNHSVLLNESYIVNVQEFSWDPQLRGLILGSFFYGYILTQLPGGWLSAKVGGKFLFGGGIVCTAILTMITPSCAKLNVYLLIFIRILEGLFEGVTYPCIHSLWMKWAPPLERSKLATFAFSGSYVGTVLGFPLSGALAKTFGWASIFYVFGLLAISWFFLWWWLVAESPSEHSTISQAELEYIQHSIGFTQHQIKGQAVPWKSILTSLPVWAIVFAHFAENWGFYTLLTELPTFLSDVMGFDVYQVGFAAAAPYLVMAIMVIIGGQIADAIRSRNLLSTTATRKTFNCSAFVLQTIFFIVTAYTVSAKAAIICISLAVGFGGFAWSGFSVNHLDIAPQYASLLMGLSNTFATIPGMISPALTGHIAADGTKEQWRIIFYLAGVIYCCGAIFYGIFASGERQPWAEMQPGYSAHADEPAETTEE